MKIAILGCGNMGLAYARTFIQFELVKKENLLLVEKNAERCASLRKSKEGIVVSTISEDIKNYELIILSVKPQDFPILAYEIKGKIMGDQIVLSIMAGINIKTIQSSIDHKSIIRAMPNTPTMVGLGITGFTSAEGISLSRLFQVENLLNATGRSLYIENESMLDAVTAISGSGPAYFYYFVKHLVQAAVDLGFDEGTALLLVKQTMLGSYHLINNAEMSVDNLIKTVASKGGTTEAALQVFDSSEIGTSIINGIKAAEKRAKELSKN